MGQVVLLDGDHPAEGEPIGRGVQDLLFLPNLPLGSCSPHLAPVLPRHFLGHDGLAGGLLALCLHILNFRRGGACGAVSQGFPGRGALLTRGVAAGGGVVLVAAGGGSDKHDLKVLYGQGLQRLVGPVHQQWGSSKTGETEDTRWYFRFRWSSARRIKNPLFFLL